MNNHDDNVNYEYGENKDNMNRDDHIDEEGSFVLVGDPYEKQEQDIVTTHATVIDMDEVSQGGKHKKEEKGFKKVLKKFAVIAASAAVFGVIAGGTFQLILDKTGKSEHVVQQDVFSVESNTQGEDKEVIKTGNIEYKVDSTDVSDVVEYVMPSIVAINCTGEEYYNYFGRQYSQEINGSGSGIIIGQNTSKILVVTNYHVVSDANRDIEIVFVDGTTAKAEMQGYEATWDLAVLSIDSKELSEDTLKTIKVATLGDSDELKMGEMAIAIGNALGYGQSVTVGYISALNREMAVDGTTLNLIQTDAAINPGNSGGALLNIKGEVIGINSMKSIGSNVEGMGYAIPISEAIPIINELMNREVLSENESGYLGITGRDIEEDFSVGFGMPVGVYVVSVAEGSPAEKAGVKEYDIITGIKGKAISNMSELKNVLSATRAGTEVELTVMSLMDGVYTEKTLAVTLGNMPKQK